jgi:hypothetical protein
LALLTGIGDSSGVLMLEQWAGSKWQTIIRGIEKTISNKTVTYDFEWLIDRCEVAQVLIIRILRSTLLKSGRVTVSAASSQLRSRAMRSP